MAVFRHIRLPSGRCFEICASVHRYRKGRKSNHKHGLLLEAREQGAGGRAPLELLIDLSFLFDEDQTARLVAPRGGDQALETLLCADAGRGLCVSAPAVVADAVPLVTPAALEAKQTIIDHRGPCRICCVPGKNTAKLRVLDANHKEVLVCSLPSGLLRLPDAKREPMWWGEVTVNPFNITWERLEAPHSAELISRLVELASATEGTARQQHFWRFKDLDMQSARQVAEAVGAVPWDELRGLLGSKICRIIDTPRTDGSPRTFRDLKATEIFAIAHKLGRKNSWMEE